MKIEINVKENLEKDEAKSLSGILDVIEESEAVSIDKSELLKLYALCAKAGEAKAYGKIGKLIADENPEKAILYYKKGAGAGDVFSMVQLGIVLEENKMLKDAAYCYEKAAQHENPEAMYRYAGLLLDADEKIKWLRKAADKGYIYAPSALGEVYEMKENENLALFWYRQGFELGDTKLEKKIRLLEKRNEGEVDIVIEYDDEETM